MKKAFVWAAAVALTLAACGGDDSPDAGSKTQATNTAEVTTAAPDDGVSTGDSSNAGTSVDAAPPGQALVAVDGQDFAFELPGAVACNVQEGEFGFSFRIGDNEITLGGGGFRSDSGWGGDIVLEIPEPEGEVGVTQYFVDLAQHGDQLEINGNGLAYSGPWMMRPPNDGSNPPPVEVGEGTLSVTCS
jgi:hypothetical protein